MKRFFTLLLVLLSVFSLAACQPPEDKNLTKKPVLYFYPQTETACSVKLMLNGKLTCTYPAYGENGWEFFVASPDGTLTFPDGRSYYCLYWEGISDTKWDFSTGYCIPGNDTADFLADMLLRMGLTEREANEFIIYWLPQMQENAYNVISFQTDAYEAHASLEITPAPDTFLRVFMAWYASDLPVEIAAPEIAPVIRTGFTVVEWGGSQVRR